MLNYNEITQRKYIDLDGEPWEVITSQVSRKQANKPVNKTKIKSLISGKVIEKVFHSSDKAQEADLEKHHAKYLYENRGEYWFCEPDDPSKRYQLPAEVVGEAMRFIPQNHVIDTLLYNDEVIGVKVPIKMELKVNEAPPAVRGNTAQGAQKQVTLETGAVVTAPIFINEGDILQINTETGEYTSRVEKS